MPKKPGQPKELEALGRKIREASEVIGHLRDSNRVLARELEEVKLRLAEGAPAGSAGKGEASAELSLLRQERKQIRDRIVHLLERLEQISSTPSAE
jgi:hypothetical protein